MKNENRSIKFIFFTIILCLLIIAIYIIYSDNNKLAIDIEENVRKEIIKDSISIGITKVDTLNPLLTNNKDVQYILKLVYNPLIDVTKEFDLIGNLAKEWSKLDEKTYIIKLQEDKQWHDGKKFTAEDVKFTIDTIKNNWKDSIYYENVDKIEEVIIIDEYTIKLLLSEEVEFFEYKLTFPILAKHQYNENIELEDKNPVGTGEYLFKEITNEKIVLTNKDAKTKILNICMYDKTAEIYSNFVKKKIDVIITSNINFEENIGTIGYKTEIVPDRKFDYILINQNNQILQNKNIRQAIKLAINRNEIIYKVYKNKYVKANFPENNIQKNEDDFYNINKAKEILIKDGWSLENNNWHKGKQKLQIKLTIDASNEKRIEVAEIIKTELESIGIQIEIIKMNKSNYEYALKNNYYELILTGNIVPLEPDYETYFKYGNNETNSILEEIVKIDNKNIRKEKIEELKKIYEDEIQFIGLYFNSNMILYNSNMKGDFKANWFNILYSINTWYST